MKKHLSLLLAVLMILPSLAACSESKTNTEDETASAGNTEVVIPAETEPPETELPLPEADYEGWIVVEAEQDPAKANPFEYALLARNYIREKTGL